MDAELLKTLRELEMALHQPEVRLDVAQLEPLLHAEFVENGRSGKTYTKPDILDALPQASLAEIWSQGFRLDRIAPGVALLTYLSADVGEDGRLSRHARRASLWVESATGWQLRFHQGTPTAPFPQESHPEE